MIHWGKARKIQRKYFPAGCVKGNVIRTVADMGDRNNRTDQKYTNL